MSGRVFVRGSVPTVAESLPPCSNRAELQVTGDSPQCVNVLRELART
jgi:hypothetical protein